jgi:beta-galactosidase
MLNALGSPASRIATEPMEALGQNSGLIHYRTRVRGPLSQAALRIDGLADRAQVFLDGAEIGVLYRDRPLDSLKVDIPEPGAVLDILVENMGRINYGPLLADRKGISGGVRLDNQYQFGWEIRPLPLDDLSVVDFGTGPDQSGDSSGPAFHRAIVSIAMPADGFIALPGWTKGMVWLNGFALGRYWERGPQRTLYAPAPLWRSGENEVVVLELHTPGSWIEVRSEPDLGATSDAPPTY